MINLTFSGFVSTDPEAGYTKTSEQYTRWRMPLYTGKDKEPLWVTVWCFGKVSEYADNIGVRKGDWLVVSSDRPFTVEAWQDKQQRMGVNTSVYATRLDKQPTGRG